METTATIWHIIIFSLLGGVVSLLGGLVLLSKSSWAKSLAFYGTPFAAGALLAAVFLDLLPEGIAQDGQDSVLGAALVGIVLFFLAERSLRWFHHHHEHQGEKKSSASLIIVGDTLHNALDGVAIAAAFLVSVPTGIVTTIAVAAHEIPQEIGDFGLLLSKGLKRKSVLLVNILSALATTLAAVITFGLGDSGSLPTGVLLGLTAGFLLYVAMSDIIPTIHKNSGKSDKAIWQPVMLLIGALFVGLTINLAHDYIDVDDLHGHGHTHHEDSHYHD